MLAADGGAPQLGRTSDIGSTGVSINVPLPVGVGQSVKLRFDLLVDGSVVAVSTGAKAQYCILSNGEFKVGCVFTNLDLTVQTALTRFLR